MQQMTENDTPWTCRQLERLRPGEELVFYRGRLEQDIATSIRTPLYRDVLRTVAGTVARLEELGVIEIETTEIVRTVPPRKLGGRDIKVILLEYVAKRKT